MTPYLAEPGDLFACFGADNVSRFISLQTSSPLAPTGLRVGPSHVAIASQLDTDESRYWFESTTLARRPCVVRGEQASGCQVHLIAERVADYLGFGGSVDLYRLSPINSLSRRQSRELAKDLCWFVNQAIGYDTASALFSGTHLLRAADKVFSLWRPDPQAVFCSQLIAAELQTLGLMNRDNPQRFNPGRLLRQLVAQGVYYRVGSLKGSCRALDCNFAGVFVGR